MAKITKLTVNVTMSKATKMFISMMKFLLRENKKRKRKILKDFLIWFQKEHDLNDFNIDTIIEMYLEN